MNILAWIFFGLIAGLCAVLMEKSSSAGTIIGGVFLGILGAVTGGLLASIIFGIENGSFSFVSFTVAITSSIVLLVSSSYFRRA